jgi:hypothetical protein
MSKVQIKDLPQEITTVESSSILGGGPDGIESIKFGRKIAGVVGAFMGRMGPFIDGGSDFPAVVPRDPYESGSDRDPVKEIPLSGGGGGGGGFKCKRAHSFYH